MGNDEGPSDLLGPFIDRTFRFVEMIGIVALVAVALGGTLAPYEIFVGELLALVYWLEPTTNWAVNRVTGQAGPTTRLIASVAVVLVASVVTVATMPIVRDLTEALKRVL